MNKICTTLEQSQKLVELGIDINTADMFWLTTDKSRLHILTENLEKYSRWDCMPAWSLSALLGLMPTDDKRDESYVVTESHSDCYTVIYKNCWDGCIHSEFSEESLLDATFKMVCWLLENKKI